MKSFVLTIFIVSAIWIESSHSSNICDADNQSELERMTDSSLSIRELFTETKDKSNLHMIGETHFYTDTNLLKEIIRSAKTQLSGTTCLFLEIPKGGLKLWSELFQKKIREAVNSSQREQWIEFSKYYSSLETEAKSLNIPVFEIDHQGHLDGSKNEDERNIAMALNASVLLTNGSCSNAVFFVGKAHISPLENRISLTSRLRELNINPITYNVSDFGEKSDFRLSSWNLLIAAVTRSQLSLPKL